MYGGNSVQSLATQTSAAPSPEKKPKKYWSACSESVRKIEGKREAKGFPTVPLLFDFEWGGEASSPDSVPYVAAPSAAWD
jgi:hypothetical protein